MGETGQIRYPVGESAGDCSRRRRDLRSDRQCRKVRPLRQGSVRHWQGLGT